MARRCWGELYDMTIGTKLCACNIHNKITVEIQARTTSKSGNVDRQGWNLPSYFMNTSTRDRSTVKVVTHVLLILCRSFCLNGDKDRIRGDLCLEMIIRLQVWSRVLAVCPEQICNLVRVQCSRPSFGILCFNTSASLCSFS